MFEAILTLSILLIICLSVLIILIQKEFNLHKEILKIFSEHFEDELKQQDEISKRLEELLREIK